MINIAATLPQKDQQTKPPLVCGGRRLERSIAPLQSTHRQILDRVSLFFQPGCYPQQGQLVNGFAHHPIACWSRWSITSRDVGTISSSSLTGPPACPRVMSAPCFPDRLGPAVDTLSVFIRTRCAIHINDSHLAPIRRRFQNRNFRVAVKLYLKPPRSLTEPWVTAVFQ